MRLRLLFSLVLAGLLLITAGYIGWIGYSSERKEIERGAAREFALANGAATREITDFLDEPATRLLDEYTLRARRGLLNFNDDRALGLDLVEQLRVDRTLAWLDYSDARTGHFVGAWRNGQGHVVLNTSDPGEGLPVEVIVEPDGRQIPIHHAQKKDYDPRGRAWFKAAIATETTVWSEPYEFFEGSSGVTASRAWSVAGGASPTGVFAVDFYLHDLQRLLNGIAQRFNGFSAIMEPDGTLVAASNDPAAKSLTDALARWIREHPGTVDAGGQRMSRLIRIDVAGTTYLAALERVDAPSGLKCIVAGMVPEALLFREVNRAGAKMELVGIASVLVAVLAGCYLAYRISEPLRALGNDLAKVGEFQLSTRILPRSIVTEVNQVREASDRMKSGLRSFIKYVPDDLVRLLLASGKEAVLGGEMRRLTLFLSDIEGFTTHGERVAPNVLIRELAGYFEILSGQVRRHSGTIDKYIGDGLLAFFNAPELVARHENLACRAALISLQELAHPNREGPLIPFRTRIGLHCGDVLVGNVGTEDRFAYTVLGDVVNVTSRLENLNKVYGTAILASEDLRAAAGDDFEWRHLDRVALVGRTGSMNIHELVGLREAVDQDRLRDRKIYEEALGLYFAGSFREARLTFGEAAEHRPLDKAAALMMARCEHMMAQAAPVSWDGVFVYTIK